ncbi:hypothetical protein BU16DRAFT_607600 [Lophium mytilinum]|uniref:F-box domain-containing protein n=1 Tax=Lophium mytilinum TaxID=390894 RepID=A0A6A6QXG4_9PEZI|nr:hypothetical protein BU16DRAFT_607600 [Lophium mytilinum]
MAPRSRRVIVYSAENPLATLPNQPLEILELINDHLDDFRDIQNVRLVCRSLEAAAWRAFGFRITPGPFRLVGCSLERLHDISENNAAAENIRSLTFGTERLHEDGVAALREWVDEARTKRGKDRRRAALKAYKKMFKDQERALNNESMYELLLDSLQKLSKVESIGIHAPMNFRDIKNFKRDPHPMWPGITAQKVLDEAQSKIPDLYDYYRHRSLLAHILAAVSESGLHLKELKTTAAPLGLEAFRCNHEYIRSALRGLETLSLTIEKQRALIMAGSTPVTHLPGFLALAPNLTTLDLTFPSERPRFGQPVSTTVRGWLPSISHICFQYLKTLKLAQFATDDAPLRAYLAQHAATLRVLHLASGIFQQLGNVLDGMRSDLQLEEVVVLEPQEAYRPGGYFIPLLGVRAMLAAERVLVTNRGGRVVIARPVGMAGSRTWSAYRNNVEALG